MNNEELLQVIKKSNDYLLANAQQSEQRIIDELTEKFEPRVRSLEDTRTFQRGMVKVITWVSVTISPGIGYALIKVWKILQGHKNSL